MKLTVAFNWRDIPITAAYNPDYAHEAGISFGRLDISAASPLPISKEPAFYTLVPHAGLIEREGPEAFIRAWLDETLPEQLPLIP